MMDPSPPDNPWTRRDRRRFAKAYGLLPYCRLLSGGVWGDLGCGDGIFTAALADLLGDEARVIAIDREAGELRRLQRNLYPTDWARQIQPVQADFRSPLPLRGIDGLLVANALHFLPDGHKLAAFRSFAAAVRPGGSLVVIEYNTDRPTGSVPHPASAQRLRRMLQEAGWQNVGLQARVPSTYLGEMAALKATRH
jgi:SAM-dependent methyltransferase